MLVVTVVQDIKVILDHLGSCWIIFDHPKYEVDNNYSEQHPAVMATCLFHGGKLFIFFLVVCRCACSGRSGEKLWLLSLCVFTLLLLTLLLFTMQFLIANGPISNGVDQTPSAWNAPTTRIFPARTVRYARSGFCSLALQCQIYNCSSPAEETKGWSKRAEDGAQRNPIGKRTWDVSWCFMCVHILALVSLPQMTK